MSDIRRVLTAAKQDFIPALNRHGFARYRTTNSFFREVDQLLHIVSFFGHRSGGSFRIVVDVWSPDFVGEDSPMTRNEIASTTWLGGQLSSWQADSTNWAWDIGSDAENLAALQTATALFETLAMPWFDCLSNDHAVARAAKCKGMPAEVLARLVNRCATSKHACPVTYPINTNNWWTTDDDQAFLSAGGQTLCDELKALGFRYEGAPLMQFVRRDGVYVHVMRLDSVSAGIHAIVRTHVWTKWVSESVFDETQQPNTHYFAVNGGFLGSEGIDQGQLAWLVAGPTCIKETVPALLLAMQTHALPWFAKVSSREAYYDSIANDVLPVDRRAKLLSVLAKKLPSDQTTSNQTR